MAKYIRYENKEVKDTILVSATDISASNVR